MRPGDARRVSAVTRESHAKLMNLFTDNVTQQYIRRMKYGRDDGREHTNMTNNFGAPPKSGWAKMVTELHVADLTTSLAFWRGILDFEVAYQRPEERFVYLEHAEEHQVMLCQRNGRFETGPMAYPLGQGAMFQLFFGSIEPVLRALEIAKHPIYLGPREVWRRVGEFESGLREVFVQDPDGYLLMLAASIGRRTIAEAG